MHPRDTGAPQHLPLVKDHTISQKYTEDSDRGMCPPKDAQTDRRTEADCTAQSGQTEADAG